MKPCGLHCLQMEHITVRRDDVTLIEDVGLHVHCGEMLAIIGRNGAGKSTLLKTILGEIPHEGTLVFSGHDGKAIRRAAPRIGYVPQALQLDKDSPATVYDMAMALTSRYPIFLPPRRRQKQALAEHLQRFDVAHLIDRPVGRLSGGELQRVMLAVATTPKPDVLVLDEPVSGVDRAGLQAFYEQIDQLRQEDMVLLLVSHDLPYVKEKADKVLLLDRTVRAYGTPEEVFSSEAFADAFAYQREGVR
ncbi:MAG: metal ABC transporter ATP-binding protein [Clostridia bacterium]|nr:metal ABC transporter ATP-binding protein [Clostridia bacterium]